MIAICPYCNIIIQSRNKEELAELLAHHVTSKHDSIEGDN